MRIYRNLFQAIRGLRLNKGNTLLMTLGVVIGIASLTVIVAKTPARVRTPKHILRLIAVSS